MPTWEDLDNITKKRILRLKEEQEELDRYYPKAYPQAKYPNDLSPLEKAKRILQHKEEVAICVKANICPVCGEELTRKLLAGYRITYCKKDRTHYCDYSFV
jgi:predicted amidohydrolase